jgi:hypothetical protein
MEPLFCEFKCYNHFYVKLLKNNGLWFVYYDLVYYEKILRCILKCFLLYNIVVNVCYGLRYVQYIFDSEISILEMKNKIQEIFYEENDVVSINL